MGERLVLAGTVMPNIPVLTLHSILSLYRNNFVLGQSTFRFAPDASSIFADTRPSRWAEFPGVNKTIWSAVENKTIKSQLKSTFLFPLPPNIFNTFGV